MFYYYLFVDDINSFSWPVNFYTLDGIICVTIFIIPVYI